MMFHVKHLGLDIDVWMLKSSTSAKQQPETDNAADRKPRTKPNDL
jgi:hypothetical protein